MAGAGGLSRNLVQDYVISPASWESMELHPLAAIFGVLAGGEIAAFWGSISLFQ
jgi:predicted PurR-regulated permease PerM